MQRNHGFKIRHVLFEFIQLKRLLIFVRLLCHLNKKLFFLKNSTFPNCIYQLTNSYSNRQGIIVEVTLKSNKINQCLTDGTVFTGNRNFFTSHERRNFHRNFRC